MIENVLWSDETKVELFRLIPKDAILQKNNTAPHQKKPTRPTVTYWWWQPRALWLFFLNWNCWVEGIATDLNQQENCSTGIRFKLRSPDLNPLLQCGDLKKAAHRRYYHIKMCHTEKDWGAITKAKGAATKFDLGVRRWMQQGSFRFYIFPLFVFQVPLNSSQFRYKVEEVV